MHRRRLGSTRIPIAGSDHRNIQTLQWRHNECDDVSNHRRLYGLLNRLFRGRETIKAPRHWPLWGEFAGDWRIPLTKGASTAENVSIWWRHQESIISSTSKTASLYENDHQIVTILFLAFLFETKTSGGGGGGVLMKRCPLTSIGIPMLKISLVTVLSLTCKSHTWERRSLYWDGAQVPGEFNISK